MNLIKYYRGKYRHYKPDTVHKDSLYFATDTKGIYLNGSQYGSSGKIQDVVYKDGILTIIYVDGTEANYDISTDLSQIQEAIDRLNQKVFPLTITVRGGGIFEKRTTQNITVSWTVKLGDEIVVPDEIYINNEIVANSTTSKTFTGVTENITYTVKIVNDGIEVSGSISVLFVNPSYFGIVEDNFNVEETLIKSLNKIIKNTKSYNGTVSLINQKVCYAYPKLFGALTSIKDANNFDYINSYTRTEINIWDEQYYVYVLADPTTITTFKQTYS